MPGGRAKAGKAAEFSNDELAAAEFRILFEVARDELREAKWLLPTAHVDVDFRYRRDGAERFLWTLWAGLSMVRQNALSELLRAEAAAAVVHEA